MKAELECMPCMLNSILTLFKELNYDNTTRETIYKKVMAYLAQADYGKSPPEIARGMHRIIKEITGNPDPYREIKEKYNHDCREILEKMKRYISGGDRLMTGLKLTLLGNIIDFGIHHSFDLDDTLSQLQHIELKIDDSPQLFREVEKAEQILYIGDNAGEVIFDNYFIELLDHKNIYFATRGMPIINDITRDDITLTQIDQYAKIIDTGQDVPGVDLQTAGDEFKEIFHKSDLIISKGQGNFETLSHNRDKKIFFLLMVKCNCVARQVGVNKNDIVVMENNFKI